MGRTDILRPLPVEIVPSRPVCLETDQTRSTQEFLCLIYYTPRFSYLLFLPLPPPGVGFNTRHKKAENRNKNTNNCTQNAPPM